MNSSAFLDELRRVYGLTSDYQLGKLTGWKASRISNYRHRSQFDADTCLQVAELLHLDPLHVIASINAVRPDTRERQKWALLAERTRHTVAKIAAPLTVAVFLSAGTITGISPPAASAAVTPLYIMRTL
ncbi:MAG TPA: hypothetical protein VFX47_02900 [Gammaproteobacteria bacterium]|nr:hypothetical protein [Gammaproteobacteria bacterium]